MRVCTLVIINDGERVLLGMKKRGFGQGRWNGFGGKVAPGETIDAAASRELREEAGIAYESRQRGTMQLFRTEQQFASAEKDIKVLQDSGVPYQLLTREQVAQAEPALATVKEKLVGALRLPNDETGDCALFTTRLAAMAEALGVSADSLDGRALKVLDLIGNPW